MYIIRRTVTTTTPKSKDYYNGNTKSMWSNDKKDGKSFKSYGDAICKLQDIRYDTCETYPLSIIRK